MALPNSGAVSSLAEMCRCPRSHACTGVGGALRAGSVS